MKTTIIIIVILIIIILGAFFILPRNNSQTVPVSNVPTVPVPEAMISTTSASVAPASVAPVSAVSSASISIKNFAFNPSTVTVKVGTKVTWTNNDSVAHTVTSDSGTVLASSAISPGQSYSVVLNDVGSISYHCNIHPMMHGTITVTN